MTLSGEGDFEMGLVMGGMFGGWWEEGWGKLGIEV